MQREPSCDGSGWFAWSTWTSAQSLSLSEQLPVDVCSTSAISTLSTKVELSQAPWWRNQHPDFDSRALELSDARSTIYRAKTLRFIRSQVLTFVMFSIWSGKIGWASLSPRTKLLLASRHRFDFVTLVPPFSVTCMICATQKLQAPWTFTLSIRLKAFASEPKMSMSIWHPQRMAAMSCSQCYPANSAVQQLASDQAIVTSVEIDRCVGRARVCLDSKTHASWP